MENPEKWNSEEKRLERKERLSSLKAKDGGKKPISTSSKGFKIFIALVSVALILAVGVWGVIYFAVPQKIFAPMKISSKNVSSVEFSFFYANTLQQLQIDTKTPEGAKKLSEKCTEKGFETKTWHEYALDLTAKSIVEIQIQYDLAKAEKIELAAEDTKGVDDTFDNFIKQMGDRVKADKYLIDNYGKNVTIDTLKPILLKQTLASKYSKTAAEKITVSDAEIKDEYTKNADKYDAVTMHLSYFPLETKENATDAETKKFDANAKALAESFLVKVTDANSFKTLTDAKNKVDEAASYAKMTAAEKKTADEKKAADAKTEAEKIAVMTAEEKLAYESGKANQDTTRLSGIKKEQVDGVSADMGTWLYDKARKLGDKKSFSSQGGYYAIYFVSKDTSFTLPTVRHILVSPNKTKADAAQGGAVSFTKEEWTAARVKAQGLLAKATSLEKFIELVKANTADTASAETGGLYENVERGKMMPEFNDWCFDASRKAGDQGIVRTDYGFHIMRYIEMKSSTALSQNSEAIKTALSTTKMTAILDSKKALPEYKYEISDLGVSLMGLKPKA